MARFVPSALRFIFCVCLGLSLSLDLAGAAFADEPLFSTQPRAETAAPLLKTSDQGGSDPLNRIYGLDVEREVDRLRGDRSGEHVFMVLDTGQGYIQCEPYPQQHALYCEAQSPYGGSALNKLPTAERVAQLRAAGFDDADHQRNYSRTYDLGQFGSAKIAGALLAVLHDAYGYSGSPNITLKTEVRTRILPDPPQVQPLK